MYTHKQQTYLGQLSLKNMRIQTTYNYYNQDRIKHILGHRAVVSNFSYYTKI